MLSSDSGSDDEQYTFVPHESIKDVLTIIHKGKPPKEPQPFAMGSNKKVRWPVDLWDSGTLIYSIENPNINLKPPVVRTDKTLRFNSRFESGNLSLAYQLSPDTYHLILEYDKNKSGSCQWFYFQIKNIKKDIKYTFNISGFHKFGGVFTSGAKVFIYSQQGAKQTGISWVRDGFNYQFGITKRTEKSIRCTLQFQIKFNYNNDTVYFAYGIPYSYSFLLQSIDNWQKKCGAIFSHETLCQSYGGRDCPLITITNPSIPDTNKQYLMFTARCHPGESNGSVILHGLIDFFLSSNPSSEYLRNHYIIKIVPMICIDGVVEGFYRICLCGSDLNRMWCTPNPSLHPIVYHTKELLKKYNPTVYIDFHGHSRSNGTFAFGCPNNDENHDREKILPKIISYTSSAFTYDKCCFSIPPSRQTASRCVAKLEMGILQSFTIETSFGGICNSKVSSFLYDEGIWRQIGMDIGVSIYNLLTPEFSKVRSLVERELKIGTPEQKSPTKGILSTSTVKITTPVKRISTNKSVQVFHNRPPMRQQLSQRLGGTIQISVF